MYSEVATSLLCSMAIECKACDLTYRIENSLCNSRSHRVMKITLLGSLILLVYFLQYYSGMPRNNHGDGIPNNIQESVFICFV